MTHRKRTHRAPCDRVCAGDRSYQSRTHCATTAIARASIKHRVVFGPLRWSELKTGDEGVLAPPADAPPGVKLLHVEATVIRHWPREEPAAEPAPPSGTKKIIAGVTGDFQRYRYRPADKRLLAIAMDALGKKEIVRREIYYLPNWDTKNFQISHHAFFPRCVI